MKPKSQTIIFNNYNFQLEIDEFGAAEPKRSEVLNYVGLPLLNENLFEQMFKLLCEDEYTKAVRLVAYIHDITEKKAYVRIIKFFIVQTGLGVIYTKSINEYCSIMQSNLLFFTGLLRIFTEPTYEVIIELFRREGFISESIELSLLAEGYIPKAEQILSEDKYVFK